MEVQLEQLAQPVPLVVVVLVQPLLPEQLVLLVFKVEQVLPELPELLVEPAQLAPRVEPAQLA
jgi:hypothetical protein